MMVSSYLICDACGQFGPPAGFLHENGLRLCYSCWYRERRPDPPPVDDATEPASDPESDPDALPDRGR